MGDINYQELLRQLEAADHETGNESVNLVFLAVNRSKQTGGEWVELFDVKKCGLPYHCADHEMRGFIDKTGKVTPVHLRLVFQYNNLTVYP